EGVAGVNEDEEKYQGVDRLVDVMLGDEFGFMIVAKPMSFEELMRIEENLNEFYTKITPLSKKSVQDSTSTSEGTNKTSTKGESTSTTKSHSVSNQESNGRTDGESKSDSKSTTRGKSDSISESNNGSSSSTGKTRGTSDSGTEGKTTGTNWSVTVNKSKSKTEGDSKAVSTNSSASEGVNKTIGSSSARTVEFVEKEYQDWIKYIDEVVTPRLDYGKGKGAFNTAAFLFAKKKAVLVKLESTIKSLFAGETGNRIPLKSIHLDADNTRVKLFKNYQIPHGKFTQQKDKEDYYARSVVSQYSDPEGNVVLGNWISSNELSLIAGLPQKEVVGLGLREEVQFGLNVEKKIKEENKINLGKLVHSGNILKNIDICIDKEELDKHVFITGVTGSGKTTTCQKILMDSELPFLVIEPAKTEYRILANRYDDILIFTLGRDNVAPFRLNPFEFFPHESITSRVDMIKASMEASFDMEAAIPQILENAIYECYKDYGWNIATNKNEKFEDPFKDGVYAFPTFSDLIKKVDKVVDRQGFDERLKRDYIGSIKARLEGLTVGAKGLMLDTRRSIDFEQLLDRKVVLELEEVRSGSEKSLIMGFILTNLSEAIKAKFKKTGEFDHIT
ncbi:MAG: helicase HerA domain-containing protein, partial [Intestinibacter sp.]